MTQVKTNEKDPLFEEMFTVGAHLGYAKQRRHPSTKERIFGRKNNNNEIISLETIKKDLDTTLAYAHQLGKEGKTLLFAGNKPEAREIIKTTAESINMPYVANRWIGGILTNFSEIKKRLARLAELLEKQEKGELSVYTKKEQLLIEKEIGDLKKKFEGIAGLKKTPDALFVVDSKAEEIAVLEAKSKGIPILSLSSSDCNIEKIDYPIVANDSSVASISFFTKKVADAFSEGAKEFTPELEKKEEEK